MAARAKSGPPEAVLHFHEQLEPLGDIECRRFFGGWSFRKDGVQFAGVLRGNLFLSVDPQLREALIAEGCTPFRYAKKDREVVVEKYYTAPSACLDDPDVLVDWAAKAIAATRRLQG